MVITNRQTDRQRIDHATLSVAIDRLCYACDYYYYTHLTASFHDNLSKPVPER